MGFGAWALILIGGIIAWKIAFRAEGAAITVPIDRFEQCLHDDSNNSCSTPGERTSMVRKFIGSQGDIDDMTIEISLAKASDVAAQYSGKIGSLNSLDELVVFISSIEMSGAIKGACYAAGKEVTDYQAKFNATRIA